MTLVHLLSLPQVTPRRGPTLQARWGPSQSGMDAHARIGPSSGSRQARGGMRFYARSSWICPRRQVLFTSMGFTCQMTNGGVIPADAMGVSFSPTPSFTNITAGSITANGTGFSSTYGMPLFQYFDTNGTLIAQTNATSVATGGTSATGPVPSNIGSVPPGVYLARISNAASGGSYSYLNTGSVTVANGGVAISGQERQKN